MNLKVLKWRRIKASQRATLSLLFISNKMDLEWFTMERARFPNCTVETDRAGAKERRRIDSILLGSFVVHVIIR